VVLKRRDRLRLAGEAELDPRTIERAQVEGVQSIRSESDRERLRKALRRLHLELPEGKREG
jgi:hypothetical protein